MAFSGLRATESRAPGVPALQPAGQVPFDGVIFDRRRLVTPDLPDLTSQSFAAVSGALPRWPNRVALKVLGRTGGAPGDLQQARGSLRETALGSRRARASADGRRGLRFMARLRVPPSGNHEDGARLASSLVLFRQWCFFQAPP
jgi:hypothetical protein